MGENPTRQRLNQWGQTRLILVWLRNVLDLCRSPSQSVPFADPATARSIESDPIDYCVNAETHIGGQSVLDYLVSPDSKAAHEESISALTFLMLCR